MCRLVILPCLYECISFARVVTLKIIKDDFLSQDVVIDDGKLPSDPLCTSLMQVLTSVLTNAPDDVPTTRLQDVVRWVIARCWFTICSNRVCFRILAVCSYFNETQTALDHMTCSSSKRRNRRQTAASRHAAAPPAVHPTRLRIKHARAGVSSKRRRKFQLVFDPRRRYPIKTCYRTEISGVFT